MDPLPVGMPWGGNPTAPPNAHSQITWALRTTVYKAWGQRGYSEEYITKI